MKQKLVIIGDSDFGQIAYEYFTHDSNYEVVGFAVEADYKKRDVLFDLPVIELEKIEEIFPAAEFFVFTAITYLKLNTVRERLYLDLKKKNYLFANYISSRCFFWHNVEIGENNFIFEDNTIQPFVKIGNNNIFWSGNHIGHHSSIEDNCFISSHVTISGHCNIDSNCFIGVNASIANNVNIGKKNFISPGVIILKSTGDNEIYKENQTEKSPVSSERFLK